MTRKESSNTDFSLNKQPLKKLKIYYISRQKNAFTSEDKAAGAAAEGGHTTPQANQIPCNTTITTPQTTWQSRHNITSFVDMLYILTD